MTDIFIKLLNMSITASYLCLAVVFIRLIFKKMPKWISCVLWGMVGIRLVFPFSFESVLSLIPSSETVPSDITLSKTPHITSGIHLLNSSVNSVISEAFTPRPYESANPLQVIMFILAVLWLIGVAVMLIYALISYVIIKRRTNARIKVSEGYFLCDSIDTPFILGILKPKIYIPSFTDEKDLELIISHENAHIKRLDYLWKPLGFLLLSVHWFNPLIWLAYVLLCRDIEAACDEKVIKQLGTEIKKPYSETLIGCASPKRLIKACPLAFGETDTKSRIINILNYKKPALWIIISAIIISLALSVCFMTNPVGMGIEDIEANENIFKEVNKIQLYIGTSYIYTTEDTADLIRTLKKVKLEKNPVNESLDESRNKAYRIEINDKTSINIDESFTILWTDDSVKPSYSYEIKNPVILTEMFSICNYTNAEKMPGIYVTVNAVEKTFSDTTFTVTWHNNSKEEVTYGEMFSVEYKNGDSWEEIPLPENFAFHAIGYLLKPNSSVTKDYYLPTVLTESGTYRLCMSYHSDNGNSYMAHAEFSVLSPESFVGGADAPTSVTVKPTKLLTLEDVIRLSKKGEELTLSDFDDYIYQETGSGLYIRHYEIDEMFSFYIGFTSMQDEPLYYYLTAKDGKDQAADIRYNDAEEYINTHKDNPVVKNISLGYHTCFVDNSGENFSNFTKLGAYNSYMAYSHILVLPSMVIKSSSELQNFKNAVEDWADFDISTEYYESFNDISFDYDDDFFENNSLIVAYHSVNSANNDVVVNKAYVCENELCISVIEYEYTPQTDTQRGIFICAEVSKSDTEDISEFLITVYSGAENPEVQENIYKSFTFKNTTGAQWSPDIDLYKDKTFVLTVSPFSSYFGTGSYIEENNKLTLHFDDGLIMNFDIKDDNLYFNKSESSQDIWFFYFPDNTIFNEIT